MYEWWFFENNFHEGVKAFLLFMWSKIICEEIGNSARVDAECYLFTARMYRI